MKNYQIQLKILTPIHMGTGECYEMFDFVMTRANPPYSMHICHVMEYLVQNIKLMRLIQHEDPKQRLQAIKKTAYDNAHNIYNSEYYKYSVPVSQHIYDDYKESIIKIRDANNPSDFNQSIIHRTAYNGLNNAPYIPASGIKGAIKTAVFSIKNNKVKHQKINWNNSLQKNLLNGDFNNDPFSLIKASDLHPLGDNTNRHIQYVHRINTKYFQGKTDNKELKQSIKDNLTIQAEMLLPPDNIADTTADYTGTLTIPPYNNKKLLNIAQKMVNIPYVLSACNDFYKPKFEQYVTTLQKGYFKDKTKQDAESLQYILDNMDNNSCIINIGKYGGAELKTMDGTRKIISRNPKPKPNEPKFTDVEAPKTIGISGEQKKLEHCESIHQMGWAMLMIKEI